MSPAIWEKILDELEYRYSRSSGPGGQHVNRTESKVDVRWDLESSAAVTDTQKARLRHKLATRLNKDGILIISCDEYRYRARNIEESQSRLKDLLTSALKIPKPRKKTKPTKSSVKKRLEGKKQRSDLKKSRGKIKY
ncbi:MAG: aminoacyl-tRNA hydrolase [Bdellovibrionaceae bacterium]|nr:aminoacyl-tRNA hydrolase [Bdellovibrionales bacterium]MCB9084274.1 aminoacyl-tRNA hydrolase [Pseudobdellovibrionaceae bacterium]